MSLHGIAEIHRVDRIEELVIGHDVYRIEVLRCTQSAALEPAFQREVFTARAYERLAIEVRAAGRPVTATVWSQLPLPELRDDQLEDRVLEEARVALFEEVTRRRSVTKGGGESPPNPPQNRP
jgi:hypothetical protein